MNAFRLFLAGLFLGVLLGSGESFGAAASGMTQTVSGGGVTAKVTYLNPKSNEDPRFQLALDTHSVNLDAYDLKGLTVLRDDTGKKYAPIGTENKGTGHHKEVILVFPKVSSEAKGLELAITALAGVKERIFRWNLE